MFISLFVSLLAPAAANGTAKVAPGQSREGLDEKDLNMRWDVMCPLCRGAKATAPALDELRKGVHCPTCSIDYEANFTQNVELTFTPHPQIRAINAGTYCIGGPMITPHILIHQVVQPGETRTLHTRLEPGNYRVRTQRPGVEQWLETSILCFIA